MNTIGSFFITNIESNKQMNAHACTNTSVYARTRTCSSGSACIFLSAELATMSLTSSCNLEKASPDRRGKLRGY
jgi:hypothetical protein